MLAPQREKRAFSSSAKSYGSPELRRQANEARRTPDWQSPYDARPLGEDRRQARLDEVGVAQGIISPLSMLTLLPRWRAAISIPAPRLSRRDHLIQHGHLRALERHPARLGRSENSGRSAGKPAPRRGSADCSAYRRLWRNSKYSFAGCRTRDIRSSGSSSNTVLIVRGVETPTPFYRTSNRTTEFRPANSMPSPLRGRVLAPTALQASKVAVRR